MGLKDFEAISEYCEGIESLTPAQIDLIMNQDNHLYYKVRCAESKDENPEDPAKSIKIQIQVTCNYQKPEKGTETEDDMDSPTKNFTQFSSLNYVPKNDPKPSECLYLPHFPCDKASDYCLLYAPSNIYVFLTFFHSIYERVLKAQDLIREKISQDIAEMSSQDQEQVSEKKEMFYKERYEHLLKGIYATTTSSGTIPATSVNIMDHNKYEDFARQLLGQNAFLLF